MGAAEARDQALARMMLERGWLSREVLLRCLEDARQRPELGLVGVIAARRLLPAERLERLRRAAEGGGHRRATAGEISAEAARVGSLRPAEAPRGTERLVQPVMAAPSAPSAPSADEALVAGYGMFGDYRILGTIGRGAMGAVLHARHEPSGEEVALKVIAEREPDADDLARFRREAEALIRLSHPNIVGITDFGEVQGRMFLAMPRIPGEALDARIKRGWEDEAARPEAEEVAGWFLGLARALEHIHAAGIVHRDIKPANVVIEVGGERTVLIDFGLIRPPSGSPHERLTLTGEMVGTPAFMSPEQFAHRGAFGESGAPADIWGFGASLHYALSGELPFPGSTAVDIYRAIRSDAPAPLAEAPAWLAELAHSCLRVPPAERPSAAELVAALEAGLADAPASRRGLVGLGALALALAAGLGGWALWPRGPVGPPALLALELAAKATDEAGVEVSGQLARAGALRIGEQRVETAADGSFRHRALLDPGRNRIAVSVPGGEARELEVVRDAAPPDIELLTPEVEGIVTLERGGLLRGRVRDETRVALSLNEARLSLDEQGFFSWQAPEFEDPEAALHVRLRARDEFGRVTERPLQLRAPAEQRERRVEAADPSLSPEDVAALEAFEARFLELRGLRGEAERWRPLMRRERWQRARELEQDAAIAAVTARLGAGVTALGTRRFECGGQAHRIATFRHEASGLVFHLLPGGLVERTWWANPEMGYIVSYLRTLASEEVDIETIAWVMRAAPYKRLKTDVAKTLGLAITEGEDESNIKEDLDVVDARRRMREQPERIEAVRRLAQRHLSYYEGQVKHRTTREVVGPLLMMRTEMPERAWFRVAGRSEGSDSPVDVGWGPLQAWLTELQRRDPRLRLPTELEREHACRAGVDGPFFWGSEREGAHLRVYSYERGGGFTAATQREGVTENAFGLVDMLGNSEEWCEPDWGLWRQRRPDEPLSDADWRRISRTSPLAGGSSLWHSSYLHIGLFVYHEQSSEPWGHWSFRLAMSIP